MILLPLAMFYDIEDPNSFSKDIFNCLRKWYLGIRIFLLSTSLKNLTYDQICHEYVTYYTLSTFKSIAEKNGLKFLIIH